MKKFFKVAHILLALSVLFAILQAPLIAEKMKPIKMQEFWNLKPKVVEKKVEPKKKKNEVQLNRETLKKKVVTRKNGDIFAPEIPSANTLTPSLPPYIDAIIGYYFAWIDLKAVEESVAAYQSNKNIAKTPKRTIEAVNNAISGDAARLNEINVTLGNIKSRISEGVNLYWICHNDTNFFMFANIRSEKRAGFSDISKWKDELAKQKYLNTKFQRWGGAMHYLIVGVNMESGEVAITPTNARDVAFFITIQEMKQLSIMLVEPAW